MLPSTSQTQSRSDAVILAGELPKAPDLITRPRVPEPKEFESMADHIVAAGYFGMAEPIDSPNAERAQLLAISAEGRAGGARLLRKMLGAEAPPAEAEVGKPATLKEMGIVATIKGNKALGCIGDVLRFRLEAVNASSESLYPGGRACPPLDPAAPPKLTDAPRALQDPGRERAAEVERARPRRNAVQTSFSDAGQPALEYLRYVVVG